MRAVRLVGLLVVSAGLMPVAQGHPALSWTQQKNSPVLYQSGTHAVTVLSPPPSSRAQQPVLGSQVVKVHVRRHVKGAAVVQSQVCWKTQVRCVPLVADTLETTAFNGAEAAGPVVVTHRVLGKGNLPGPVVIETGVIVWFTR